MPVDERHYDIAIDLSHGGQLGIAQFNRSYGTLSYNRETYFYADVANGYGAGVSLKPVAPDLVVFMPGTNVPEEFSGKGWIAVVAAGSQAA